MATRQLVHKQFNSPLALYSDRNVKETLDRELKVLSSGAVGINFDDPSTTRPGSLAKSAVLAALEEEEKLQKSSNHQIGLKRVAWPPPADSGFDATAPEDNSLNQQFSPTPQQQQFALAPQQQNFKPQARIQQVKPSFNGAPKPILAQVAPIYSYQVPRAAPPSRPAPLQTFAAPTAPIEHIIPVTHALPSPKTPTAGFKPLSPLPALQTAPQYANSYSSSSPASSATYSAHSPRGWSHVQPSAGQGYQIRGNQFNQSAQFNQGQQHSLVCQQSPPAFDRQASAPAHYHQQPQVQQQFQAVPTFESLPIALQQAPYNGNPLRKEAPVSQRPAPVFASQPTIPSYQGGMNSRGDQKWPPAEHKQQVEEENQQRRDIAAGPACRPKRVNKDYSQFFAQNALNSTYPGYRMPPGTSQTSQQTQHNG